MTTSGKRKSHKKQDGEPLAEGSKPIAVSDEVKTPLNRWKEYGIIVLDSIGEYQEGILRAAQCLVNCCGLDLGALRAEWDKDEVAEFEECIMDTIPGKPEIDENGAITFHEPEQQNPMVDENDEDLDEQPFVTP